jgi:putative ABC transport system permease protein
VPPSLDQVPSIQYRSVYGDYFHSLGIRLLEGRVFNQADGKYNPLVAVINKAAAKHFWPNQNPIGKVISMVPPASLLAPGTLPKGYQIPWTTVVGIVDDVHYGALSADALPVVYAPMSQGDSMLWNFVTVRTQSDPTTMVASIRSVLSQIDKDLPMANIVTMDQIRTDSVAQPRLESLLFGLFGGLGLMLAAVGVYGVISYSTTLRTREIGIRMALGAQRADVLKMVLGQGIKLAGVGVGIGLALSLVLTRFLASLLYGVKTTDPLTFAVVGIVLIGVSMLAGFIPARRAAKVDPMVALRYE